MYTCPCCGYATFAAPPGSLATCPDCGWQDDLQQLYSPFLASGANPYSLADAQVRFVQFGAPSSEQHMRDPHWFPLWQQKADIPDEAQPAGSTTFDLYYWLRTARASVPEQPVGLRRVRNRIIEYLELASSFEAQRRLQDAAPAMSAPDEVLNQWEDWVTPDWKQQFVEPVFSAEERNGIAQFAGVWRGIANGAPHPLPRLEVLFATPNWQSLQRAAAALLAVFLLRGRSDEH
ncbi:CPCC family cysteine-rich protein [Pseudoduganella sp. OTU4001]|uniref:CPCC family cysteine-rich protein n=1 Tax=Pseudoduganella sp. OTU4001 TaxID=3043854 RepID=UPI00313AA46D